MEDPNDNWAERVTLDKLKPWSITEESSGGARMTFRDSDGSTRTVSAASRKAVIVLASRVFHRRPIQPWER